MPGYEEDTYAFTNANAYTDLIDQFLKEREQKLIENSEVVVEDVEEDEV